MSVNSAPHDHTAAHTHTTRVEATHTDDARAVGVNVNALNLEAATTIEPAPTFDTLAPELKLQILSEVPIRQIPKLRETCKAFHALIDEHENSIAQERIGTSLAGLDDFIKTHITYSIETVNGESAFMKALTAFVNLRGVVKPSFCFEWMMVIDWFLENWRYRLSLTNGLEKNIATDGELEEDEASFIDPLQSPVYGLATLHTHHHVQGCELDEEDVVFYQDKWLETPPTQVGLESLPEMHAVLQAIKDGAWLAAKVFPECPIMGCLVDSSPSLYGINPTPFWDTIKECREMAKAVKKAREAQERAAIKDAEDGWSIVGPFRRKQKQKDVTSNVSRRRESVASKPGKRYSDELDETEQEAYDDFMNQPIFCGAHGIYYEQGEDDAEALEHKFQRIFGVSNLLEGTPFRYFVKSKWAYNTVIEVLSRGTELRAMQMVAVMEELYIC